MTAATYEWSVQDVVINGTMEAWTGSTPDDWTKLNTVTQVTGYSGSWAAELGNSAKLYQDLQFTEYSGSIYEGRRVDDELPHMLRFYAKPATGHATWPCRLKVQVHLLNESSNTKYVYNWFKTKWESETTAWGGAAYNVMLLENDSWDRFVLPRIAAPTSAGTDVADDWFVRITLEAASDAEVDVDVVEFFPWTGTNIALKLGSTAIFCNGRNYPVRYDPRSGSVVELSLAKPYQTSNASLPATTQGTSGALTQGKFYCIGWTYYDEELGEETPMAYSASGDTGIFYEQLTGSNDSIQLDFSGVEVPNSEDDHATDNPRYTQRFIYQSLGLDDTDAVEGFIGSASWHYSGQADLADTYTLTVADNALPDPGQVVNRVPLPNGMGAPAFDVATVHKNRLYVSGGGTYRLGAGTPSNGSTVVAGYSSGTAPHSQWGRFVDRMFLQFDGEGERYTIERFVYADDVSGSHEKVYLREAYVGSNSGATSYRIFPENGRVWYSEEGDPTKWAGWNWFSLQGSEGERTTMLMGVGQVLLATTRDSTFGFIQEQADQQEGVTYAAPLSNEIGCIAPDSGVEIRGEGYWLSDEGVVRYQPGSTPRIISNQIQSIFTDVDDSDYIVRDPVDRMAVFCKGAHYPSHQQYLLAVKTVNAKVGCDVVLAYNYFFESWDIFRLRGELMDWSWSVDDDGNAVLLFTDSVGGMHIWDRGSADGAGREKGGGAIASNVVAADAYSAQLSSDNELYNIGEGLKGVPFYVKSGPGAGQWRMITRNDANSVYFAEELDETPTTSSVAEVGGIEFEWNLKDSDFGQPGRVKVLRSVSVDHRREGQGGRAEVRVFRDFLGLSYDAEEGFTVPSFDTAIGSRSMATAHEAAGYNLRLQISCSGPERPLAIRRLVAALTLREQD